MLNLNYGIPRPVHHPQVQDLIGKSLSVDDVLDQHKMAPGGSLCELAHDDGLVTVTACTEPGCTFCFMEWFDIDELLIGLFFFNGGSNAKMLDALEIPIDGMIKKWDPEIYGGEFEDALEFARRSWEHCFIVGHAGPCTYERVIGQALTVIRRFNIDKE